MLEHRDVKPGLIVPGSNLDLSRLESFVIPVVFANSPDLPERRSCGVDEEFYIFFIDILSILRYSMCSTKDGKMVKSGTPVRGSKTGRPIMVVLDLLGRKWTLRILWELKHGPLTFRELQEKCGNLSPTIVNKRLTELREANIIELETGSGYKFTSEGVYLCKPLIELNTWAKRWADNQAKKQG
jgi:DNA-binding HxlR family transcriptional regulator